MMQKLPNDEGELITQQGETQASTQEHEVSEIGSGNEPSHVFFTQEKLSSALAPGKVPAQEQGSASNYGAEAAPEHTQHNQRHQKLSSHGHSHQHTTQFERQDTSLKAASHSSTEQTDVVKLHSEGSEHSEVPQSTAAHHSANASAAIAPAMSTASVWLPEVAAVIQQQKQQQPQALNPIQQQSTLLSQQQQQQQLPSISHAAVQGMSGGSSSALPQQREAACQTHEEMHQHRLLVPDKEPVSGATDSGGEGSEDESLDKQGDSRGAKKPRLVWTSELHARFMNAVNHLGVKNAVPKTILQLMNVDGMTRENVASHLQKYRLYLKKLGGYPANAKTTPEALQQVQQQALQQQAHEAFQHSLSAMQGLPTQNTNQGYFGPASLAYSQSMTASGGPHEGFQMQGPQGPAAPPPGWLPPTASAQQAFEGQRGSSMQQMASAYGLLNTRGPQAIGPPGNAPFVQPGSQAAWSWGPGGSQEGHWGMPSSSDVEGNTGQHGHNPRYLAPHMMHSHGVDQGVGDDLGVLNSETASGQMPDALAHLLSAAEAASSEGK